MNGTKSLFAIALVAIMFVASHADAALVAQWLACGIAGDQNPPPYGLRLDGSMDGNWSHEVTWDFEDVYFDLYDDGTARLHGTANLVEFNNTNGPGIYASSWWLDTKFNLITNPVQLGAIADYHADWKYFTLDPSTTPELVNKANANDYINLWGHMESNMPFRIGFGGNGKNGNFGASGWVNYEHTTPFGVIGNRNDHHAASDFLMDLKPVPEPTTFALFGLGALGLGAWRRRRGVEK